MCVRVCYAESGTGTCDLSTNVEHECDETLPIVEFDISAQKSDLHRKQERISDRNLSITFENETR